MHIISKIEALETLEKLGRVMWLSIDVYEDARNIIEMLPEIETPDKPDKCR